MKSPSIGSGRAPLPQIPRVESICVFFTDQRGAATIWSLLWFLLMIGFAGLAVDGTDGLRNRTMLQATADSAALAAAIDLPDATAVVDTAVAYSARNMNPGEHGWVLDSADVVVGRWDATTHSIDVSDPKPDAVWVTTWRGDENSNPLGLSFLRFTGLRAWNVRAQAVAQRYIPECLRDGLIAREIVDISSNNGFVRGICVHGELGVHMQNHNFYEWETGVVVSMPKLSMMQLPAGGMESNPGLPQAMRENYLDPRMVNHVDDIMHSMIGVSETTPQSAVLPAYMTDGGATPVYHEVTEKFDLGTVRSGHIYYVKCQPNKNAQIPSNSVVVNAVIIAECEIHVGAKAKLVNVVLGSLSGGNGSVDKANVGVAAGVQLGLPDNCTPGGGVQIFSNATIHTSSSTKIDGVQMVAAGDIELGAQDYGINGISAQSGGMIKLTSNNQFGLCSGGAPDLFTVPYYRLVL